jgi:hypothetical protein
MEEKLFPRPAVAGILKQGWIEARLHTDGGPAVAENKRLQTELTRSVALPFFLAYDPVERKVLRKTAGLRPEDKFTAFLKGE